MTRPLVDGRLDMTMMYAIHAALRRDLAALAVSAAAAGDDPDRLYATHVGWELFKRFLTIHHTSEDDSLWPSMRAAVAGRPDDLELLDAMEAEHGRIDPLIKALDEALADRESGHDRLGDITDALAHEVTRHLTHEETDALPLIGRVLPEEDWVKFGDLQRARVGMEAAPMYLPWLLDGAPADRVEGVLKYIPPQLHEPYRKVWRRSYAEQNPWSTEHREA